MVDNRRRNQGEQGWAGAFDAARSRLVDLPDPAGDDGRSYAERIAAVFAQAIADKIYKQGTRLPTSASIAHRFATSVDTARHALRHLIEQGLAARVPGGAVYVRGVAPRSGSGGGDRI